MPATASDVCSALADLASAERAEAYAWFFKTGPGGYGEGDEFIGVTMPQIRAVAKRFADLPQAELDELVASPFHEHRMCGLVVMTDRFRRASRARTRDDAQRQALHASYLEHLAAGHVDNWDLVDATAEYLVGDILFVPAPADPFPALSARLAASDSVWHRRVAVVATFAAIKAGDARPTIEVATRLVEDPHDLIRKAVGWMLREVGKRISRDELLAFLDEHAARMPRVMLSYATEHLDPSHRAAYRAMR
ncbi:DNA alkylation repair protein [Agromyces larvae]|uniref:DNA alkylation repair protein n=1 Tax=Agromyces larvae TaxID=2929802 RepID=A0ABY4BVK1_9MICO|nr:DNA alkylation repair protein [Agromyces larvae]UOE43200.1 DNA alkylation repair protein [Agromyces larvae]